MYIWIFKRINEEHLEIHWIWKGHTENSKDVANDSKFKQLMPLVEVETQRKVEVRMGEEISIPVWRC
jgi:hypothetical protein